MKTTAKCNILTNLSNVIGKLLLCIGLAAGVAASAYARGQIASGTVSGSGSGPAYSYSLSFSNSATATSPIGSVWYAWVPGAFYLPGVPSTASAPSGWTAAINNNSIEFYANSPAGYIAAGSSLSGFGYTAGFSPATLATTPNSGLSDAYSAGIEVGPGDIFTVVQVPEPSTLSLLIPGAVGLWWVGRRKLCAA